MYMDVDIDIDVWYAAANCPGNHGIHDNGNCRLFPTLLNVRAIMEYMTMECAVSSLSYYCLSSKKIKIKEIRRDNTFLNEEVADKFIY
jgi:hypothetical protein